MAYISFIIQRVPNFVKEWVFYNTFEEAFGDVEVKLDIHIKTDTRTNFDFQMLFVHISTDEPSEELIEFKKRLNEEGEVWIYYDDIHYFKTKKIIKKTQKRIISKKDMEEIKNSFKKTQISKPVEQAEDVEKTENAEQVGDVAEEVG
jgi:hypothetical protein